MKRISILSLVLLLVFSASSIFAAGDPVDPPNNDFYAFHESVNVSYFPGDDFPKTNSMSITPSTWASHSGNLTARNFVIAGDYIVTTATACFVGTTTQTVSVSVSGGNGTNPISVSPGRIESGSWLKAQINQYGSSTPGNSATSTATLNIWNTI